MSCSRKIRFKNPLLDKETASLCVMRFLPHWEYVSKIREYSADGNTVSVLTADFRIFAEKTGDTEIIMNFEADSEAVMKELLDATRHISIMVYDFKFETIHSQPAPEWRML